MRVLHTILTAGLLFTVTPRLAATQVTKSCPPASRNPARDLEKCEKADPFKVVHYPEVERLKVEAQIREFLWRHWSRKRLRPLVATHYNKEGEPTTCTFSVEPEVDGRWVIREECEYLGVRG